MDTKKVNYVGFWARFAAFIIDSLVASLLLSPIALNTTELTLAQLSDPAQSQIDLTAIMLRMGLEMLAIGVLFVLFWVYFSATPGKLLFKSYIVDAATLRPATKGQLIIRYISYYVSLIPFGLGFFWVAFDEKKQGWHDKIAGTVVIDQKPLHSPLQ